MKCDVVIPVYNSPDWLELCVDAAVLSDQSNIIKKIHLIDDCSGDDTKKLIKKLCEKYDKVECVQNNCNLGFVKTCNKGMTLCSAEYILLLNSDCLLAYDTVARLIKALESHPGTGLVSPLSNNAANLSIPIPDKSDYLAIDKLLSELEDIKYPACTIVGNCLLITKACYDAVGGLDEAYGMGYGEETDYQFKAQKAGYEAIIAGNAYVFHKSQVSFGNSEKLSEQKLKNRDLFFSRWGNEYYALLDEYQHNDPVVAANRHIHENYSRLKTMSASNEHAKMVSRVNELDHKYLNHTSTPPKSLLKRILSLFKNS